MRRHRKPSAGFDAKTAATDPNGTRAAAGARVPRRRTGVGPVLPVSAEAVR